MAEDTVRMWVRWNKGYMLDQEIPTEGDMVTRLRRTEHMLAIDPAWRVEFKDADKPRYNSHLDNLPMFIGLIMHVPRDAFEAHVAKLRAAGVSA